MNTYCEICRNGDDVLHAVVLGADLFSLSQFMLQKPL